MELSLLCLVGVDTMRESMLSSFAMLYVPRGSVFAIPVFVPTAVFTLACFLFITCHGWTLFLFGSSEAFGSEFL